MAQICLECLKQFEPNANEDNTTLSDDLIICDSCSELKYIVMDYQEYLDRYVTPMKLPLIR